MDGLSGAAVAYEAASRRDESDARPLFELGRVRQQMGDLPGAAAAYDAASRRDESDARPLLKLASVRELMGDFTPAADAYDAASRRDESDARPLLKLGQVRERMGDLPGAVAACEEALARNPRDSQLLLGLGKVAKALMAQQRTPSAAQLLTRVFERSSGDVALRCFLRDRYGDHPHQPKVDSIPMLVGGGNIHISQHTITSPGEHVVDRVVQKVIRSEREIAVLKLVREVQDQLPEGISTPRVLGIYEFEDIAHVFLAHVEFGQTSLEYSRHQLERLASIYATIPAILPIHRIPEGLHLEVFSVPQLDRTVARIRYSPAFAAAYARDATLDRDLEVIATQTEALARTARALPHVFSHNDANTANTMPMLNARGDIESVLFLDWGYAGPNIVGAELHPFLGSRYLPDAKVDVLIDHYLAVLGLRVRSLERWHVEFGAHLYHLTRFDHRRLNDPRRWPRVRQAVKLGRLAADRAAAMS